MIAVHGGMEKCSTLSVYQKHQCHSGSSLWSVLSSSAVAEEIRYVNAGVYRPFVWSTKVIGSSLNEYTGCTARVQLNLQVFFNAFYGFGILWFQ